MPAALNANRRKRLAHRARHRTSQAIGRYAPAKRYPLLVAFVLESHRDVLDAVLTMFSDYWALAQRKAQREHEAHLLAIRQAREVLDGRFRSGRDIRRLIEDRAWFVDHILQQCASTLACRGGFCVFGGLCSEFGREI